MQRSIVRIAVALLSCVAPLGAQTSNPDAVAIHTEDISRFWLAVDRAGATPDAAALARSLRDEYLRDPSPGLFAWIVNRLVDQDAVIKSLHGTAWDSRRAVRSIQPAEGTADRAQFDSIVMPVLLNNASANLAYTYLARRHYYDAARRNMLTVDTASSVRDSIRTAFRRLAALYPQGRFVDVYFLVGMLSSGGTVAGNALLIGTEMFSRDSTISLAGMSAWHRAVIGEARLIPSIVTHEMIHALQARRSGPETLLAAALNEGSADFLAELVTGHYTTIAAIEYGRAHEREVWEQFTREMDGTDTSHWLYEGEHARPGRPADLGYWIGYRIAKAYYDRATDKRAAVRDILQMTDAKSFLAASGYAGQ